MKAVCDERDRAALNAAEVLKGYCNVVKCRLCIFYKNGYCALFDNKPLEWSLDIAREIISAAEEVTS